CSSRSGSIPLELEDEPACMEEVVYSTDSSSEQERNLSELDRRIQECAFNKDEGEEEEEAPGQGGEAIP
ncbi:Cytosolic carboxypeptidase 4, partial [Saguinus oedipus]